MSRTPPHGRSRKALWSLALSLAALTSGVTAQELELRPGDTVCLIGNALAERMQHAGWLEARVQARFPELELSFRNLGFSGDEVATRQRTVGFGGPDEWLDRCGADVMFAFFGFVESFGGAEGLDAFRSELEHFVDHTLAQRYGGEEAPRLVLFSSLPFQDLGDRSLPDGTAHNERIRLYNAAIEQVAAERGVPYVDLFAPMQRAYERAQRALTINGIHLTESGNDALARVIEVAVFPGDPDGVDPRRARAVRALVLEKNRLWFNRYRATDGYNVYGGRSSLSYVEGVSNYEILQRELHVLDGMCANLDRKIHAAARGEDPGTVSGPRLPPLIPVATNRPGPHTYLGGDEALARMTVAEGMEVNLFASEERFPGLVNPVQMAWDTRGRLWVATWPTYPHWEPGRPMNDRLLILDDTDGDGRADVSRTFAGDLHNPTGFEFWNGGVLVANAPDLLFLKDTDGDDVYDTKERLLHGLSSADTHHSANSFVLGPGGALYFQEGTFHQSQVENIYNGVQRNHNGCVWRFEPRTFKVERYIPYGFANPHGHVFDRWGQDFVTDGTSNLNYYALPFSGQLEYPASHGAYTPFFQQRSRPSGGTEILSSGHFPAASQGNYLVANVIGFQGIFQYELEDAGSGFGATEVDPIVHSSDPNFRPVDIEVGPDGAVYFADWHNVLIGHMQHHLRDPSRDHAHGRVYRMTWKDRPLLEPTPLAGHPIEALLESLESPDDRVRYRSRIELSGRDSREVIALTRSWVRGLEDSGAVDVHHLLEALWLQQQHDVVDQRLLEQLLGCSDFRARAAATRVVRYMLDRVEHPLRLLTERVTDEHPRVRLEAVVALSHLPTASAAEAALQVLTKSTDRFLDYALEETLRAHQASWVRVVQNMESSNPAGRAHMMKRLDVEDLERVGGYEEMLRRHGLDLDDYWLAVEQTAASSGESLAAVLFEAIDDADARMHGHVDHLIGDLFKLVRGLPREGAEPARNEVERLSNSGRRESTRRLATAARIDFGGPAFVAAEARRSGSVLRLLDSAAFVENGDARESLFDLALGHLRARHQGELSPAGRFVRIELAGKERTLSLAEVEVFVRGDNVAPRGVATQSTLNWGGVPGRALDGNRSGRWSDDGQTHTLEDQPDPWWELDLGAEHAVEQIVLWNRTDGELGKRLDGFVVRVLDEERRAVFEHAGGPAEERNAVELTAPALRARRVAARALAALRVREDAAIDALVSHFGDPDLRLAVVQGMRAIPFARWPRDSLESVGGALLMHFSSRSPEDYDTRGGREILALADEIAPFLESIDAEAGRLFRDLRRRLGPQVFVIRPVPDSLLFDRTELTVVAGHPVELFFDNTDLMPHNLLVAAPRSLAVVGMAAERMAQQPDAWDKGFVPDLPEVLYAMDLLQPGQSGTLRFDAPTDPDDYPYVCTFPGHWVRMNGVMHVVADWDDVALPSAAASAEPALPSRPFVRNWTTDDLRPHLRKVLGASAERGRVVLDDASCLTCHAIDSEGGVTGPDLTEVVERYESVEELLDQIVDPSAQILEGYESEIFLTTDGHVVSGHIVRDEGDVLLVQDDPYRDDYLELPVDEIEERATSSVSLMPAGLLSTFEREEILDLLAFLESLRAR